MRGVIGALADNRNPSSLASRLRHKRLEMFLELVRVSPRPTRILDVGGAETYWERLGAGALAGTEVVVLNIDERPPPRLPNVRVVRGDAREMGRYRDGEFDIVYSNSVLEHVGEPKDQRRAADEIRRVGKRYFVQTPNRYFVLEPHFLVPFFQFLPIGMRVAMVRRMNLGWHRRTPDPTEARELVEGTRLLSASDMARLFPDARIHRERIAGMTKSLIAIRA